MIKRTASNTTYHTFNSNIDCFQRMIDPCYVSRPRNRSLVFIDCACDFPSTRSCAGASRQEPCSVDIERSVGKSSLQQTAS